MGQSKPRPPLYVLRQEGRKRDDRAFELSHYNASHVIGMDWLKANERVTSVLHKFGYDYSDRRVRAIASLVARVIMDENFLSAIRDMAGGDFNQLFSNELEIPERRKG